MDIRLYLILYDISSPRRWRRVYRTLRRAGAWTQFSAFFCRLPQNRKAVLENDLRREMNPAEDRLIIADLGPANEAEKRLSAVGTLAIPAPPRARIV